MATDWPKNDREWARNHIGISERHESPPLAPTYCTPDPEFCQISRHKCHDCPFASAPLPRLIVAFTGLAGAGKSTAAAHLTKHRGFQRVRFAGPLKAMMAALGLSQEQIDGSEKETPCDLLCGKTPRQAMQWLGTEYGRDLIGPDLWIRAWQAAVANVPAGVPVVVDDCRFPNEAAAVTAAGGIIVRIHRPRPAVEGYQHSSETFQLPAAATLHNTMSERNLREQVDVLLRDFSWRADAAL